MRANTWQGKRDVRVETVPDPQILNDQDAIVRITSTAICSSDLHLYNGFVPSMEPGDILGHEFMGEVVELGTVREIFENPREAYTQALLAASLDPDPDVQAEHRAARLKRA